MNTMLSDVLVDGVTVYNGGSETQGNAWYGIHVGFNFFWGNRTTARTSNVIIRNSVAHHVYGDGITVAQSQTALIAGNVVYTTGLAPAGISYTPNGLWSWDSDNVTIEENEVYDTHSYGEDGGAFDIDWGSTNTTIQFNYAHDVQSYCFAIFGAYSRVTKNSVVRYNICADNETRTKGNDWGIVLYTWDGGSIDGIQISNNTFSVNRAGIGKGVLWAPDVTLSGSGQNRFLNNIISSNAPVLVDASGVVLDNNLYWYTGTGSPTWRYNGLSYSTLSNLRSATQGELHGAFLDPTFTTPTFHSLGRASAAAAFLPLVGSPAIDFGISVGDPSSRDYSGNTAPHGAGYDVGALETDYRPAQELSR
jgi:hypothetical protein